MRQCKLWQEKVEHWVTIKASRQEDKLRSKVSPELCRTGGCPGSKPPRDASNLSSALSVHLVGCLFLSSASFGVSFVPFFSCGMRCVMKFPLGFLSHLWSSYLCSCLVLCCFSLCSGFSAQIVAASPARGVRRLFVGVWVGSFF